MNLLKENYSYLFDYLIPPLIDPLTSIVIDLNNPEPLNDLQLKTIESFLSQLKLLSSPKEKVKPASKSKAERKLKKKTDSADLLYSLAIPSCFTDSFTLVNENQLKAYLYSIMLIPYVNTKSNKATIGFILPSQLPIDLSFKLTSKSNDEKYECLIKKEDVILFTQEEVYLLISYHIKLLSDYHKGHNINTNTNTNTTISIEEYYSKLISSSSPKEKKYLIVPIIQSDNSFIIHWNRVRKAKKLFHISNNAIHIPEANIEEKYSRFLKTNQHQTQHQKTFTDKTKQKIYYTSYKNTNYYEIVDIIYANDNGDSFLNKLSRYDNDYKINILSKYFTHHTDILKTFASQIMTNCTTTMGAINSFRTLNEKYNILINDHPLGYVYGRLCTFNDTLNPYRKLKVMIKQSKSQIYSLLPMNSLLSTYMSQNDYEVIRNLSSIFVSLEQLVVPLALIKYTSSQQFTKANSQYFKWACTPPSLLQDYNYETLETLGDSILKAIITIQLLYVDTSKDVVNRKSVGQLERNRSAIIKNKHLFKKGKKYKLYQYILSKPFNKDTWIFPLLDQREQVYHQSISAKTMADFIESTIGACYLFNNDIFDSVNFIHQAKLFPHPIKDQNDIDSFVYEKMKGLSIETITTEFKAMDRDITFNEVMMLNNMTYAPICSFNEFEKRIGYSFKNFQLIYQAFTHKSVCDSLEESYEKMELLGDAIVETYIILAMINIYKETLYSANTNKDISSTGSNSNSNSNCISLIQSNADFISCCSLTHIKSFLCSNSFMCKIGAFFSFQNLIFIMKNNHTFKEPLLLFSTESNIQLLINQKLNEYNSTNTTHPKFIADAFEALIGAVFLDGDITDCFKILTLIYGHFINYCAYYMKDIKYSAIHDFCILCSEKYKVFPKFNIRAKEYIVNSDNDNANEFIIEVMMENKLLCVGKGNSIESAKLNGAEIGLTKLLREYK